MEESSIHPIVVGIDSLGPCNVRLVDSNIEIWEPREDGSYVYWVMGPDVVRTPKVDE